MRHFLFVSLLLLVSLQCKPQSESAYTIGVEGIKEIEAGRYKAGIKLLKQARQLQPEQYDYPFEIGRAYFLSGDAKMAEKYLYPLQYHTNVQADLYVLLAKCYATLNESRKTPDETRKKELDALRYGIQKLPRSGSLYYELGSRLIQLDEPIKALVIFERGIVNAPEFADNYFWASKLLKATGNDLWSWIYAEVFFNLTENEEMRRTAGLLIMETTEQIFAKDWNAQPEKMDQELRFLLESNCKSQSTDWQLYLDKRNCLMNEWRTTDFPISVLIDRMHLLAEKGFLETYLATIYLESEKSAFLSWVAAHPNEYDAYVKWRFWNPLSLVRPIKRI